MQNIKYVIVISLENRSFHSILGYLEDDHENHFNFDINNNKIYCSEIDSFSGGDHIEHDIASTLYSMNNDMGNFILSNQKNVHDIYSINNNDYKPDPKYIMGYAKHGSYPILHSLADNYCVCARWFSSVPTDTYPNRSFMISAQSENKISNFPTYTSPFYNCKTIFDELDSKNINWKVYYKEYSDTLLNKTMINWNKLKKQYRITQAIDHIKNGELAQFSFIQLDDNENSIGSIVEYLGNNEKYIGDIYNTLKNSKYWNESLMLIFYDEHGGLYDPIVPLPCISPNDKSAKYKSSIDNIEREFNFNQYGVRVPAILVSPWIDNCIDYNIYDHTSILSFVESIFDLTPLTKRDNYANCNFRFLDKIRTENLPDNLSMNTKPNTYTTIFNILFTWYTYILVNIGKLYDKIFG